MKKSIALTGLALLVAAALAGPAGAGTTAEPPAATFREAAAAPAASPRSAFDGQWWRLFAEPLLDDLIARGRRSAVSLQEASARVAQARAHQTAADAARLPRVTFDASATDQSGPLINAAGTAGGLVQAGGRLSYELDILGRLSKARGASRADLRASEALLRQARLVVEADIARAYLSIRGLDAEIQVLQATAADAREGLGVLEGRRRSGFETDAAVSRARAELGAVESDALALQQRRAELEHGLGFLVGDPGLSIAPASQALARLPPAIPPGIPSDVLARRPDVAAAKDTLNAAQLRLKVARTAWLPSLTLTASGGYASPELGDLIRSSVRSLGLDLLMALPPFDGGRRRAGIDGAAADLDLASAAYRRQVLTAFRDVDDQLSALRILGERSEVAARTIAADDRALALSTSRRSNGLASRLEVLDARRAELRDRRQAVQVQSARYQATVSLVQALGGGWGAGG